MRKLWRKGKFEDSRKYFRCRTCGTINRIDRNLESDRMDTTVVDISIENIPYDTHSTTIVLDTLNWLGSVIGSSSTFYTNKQTIVNSGCWFCGSSRL